MAFPASVAADLDRDCRDELVVGRDAGDNHRWFVFGDDPSGYALETRGGDGWGIAREALSVTVGDIDIDIDIDGRDEFAVGRDGAASQSVRVLLFDDANAGFGQIASLGNGWGSGRRATATAFGNVDGDAALEMAVGRDAPDGMRFEIYDDRDANFAVLRTGGSSWGSDRRVTALAFGDLDGDGRDELVVGRNGGSGVRVLTFDDAAAGFEMLEELASGWGVTRGVRAIAVGDPDALCRRLRGDSEL